MQQCGNEPQVRRRHTEHIRTKHPGQQLNGSERGITTHADHDPVQEVDESVAFIKGQHQWCGREPLRQAGGVVTPEGERHCFVPSSVAGCSSARGGIMVPDAGRCELCERLEREALWHGVGEGMERRGRIM